MTVHRVLTAQQVRIVAHERQGGMCAACWSGVMIDDAHAHHRMRRRDLGWCPCNVVLLHPLCHVLDERSVHQRPEWARERGLIVPTWGEPADVPLWVRWPWRLWSTIDCDGLVHSVAEQSPPPA